MATSIEASIKHFKTFNTLLTKFEQNVETVITKLDRFNQGFTRLSNIFLQGNLNNNFKAVVDSMKSIGKINLNAVNVLFKIAGAMETFSRNPIPSIVINSLEQFILQIATLSKMSTTSSVNIGRLGTAVS